MSARCQQGVSSISSVSEAGTYGLPVLAQNVEAHGAFEVDVRVVYLGVARDFRGLVWVQRGDGEREVVLWARE